MRAISDEDANAVDRLRVISMSAVEGYLDRDTDAEYKAHRRAILANPHLQHVCPKIVRACAATNELRRNLQAVHEKYKGRRDYLVEQFQPLQDRVDVSQTRIGDEEVSEKLQKLGSDEVTRLWIKAVARRNTGDYDGAITAARTLLESVMRHILDDIGENLPKDANLVTLRKPVFSKLQLAPDQHADQASKQILGGMIAVIEGIGSLRNNFGDSHGQGRSPVKPDDVHTSFAVHAAGAAAELLVGVHLKRLAEIKTASSS